jgi:AraC family transcriptional regulator
MKLYIKNMVCQRCVQAVQETLIAQGLHGEKVELGEVSLTEDELSADQLAQLDTALTNIGFERIDDRRARLIEAIKNKVIAMIHHTDRIERKSNWSTLLTEELHYEYNYLSSLFSSVEGITLEHYIISQKIEKVKELLFYGELSLSEIAYKLGYSSVAHLSGQFKKVTGLTPSELKKNRGEVLKRKPLDQV